MSEIILDNKDQVYYLKWVEGYHADTDYLLYWEDDTWQIRGDKGYHGPKAVSPSGWLEHGKANNTEIEVSYNYSERGPTSFCAECGKGFLAVDYLCAQCRL